MGKSQALRAHEQIIQCFLLEFSLADLIGPTSKCVRDSDMKRKMIQIALLVIFFLDQIRLYGPRLLNKEMCKVSMWASSKRQKGAVEQLGLFIHSPHEKKQDKGNECSRRKEEAKIKIESTWSWNRIRGWAGFSNTSSMTSPGSC